MCWKNARRGRRVDTSTVYRGLLRCSDDEHHVDTWRFALFQRRPSWGLGWVGVLGGRVGGIVAAPCRNLVWVQYSHKVARLLVRGDLTPGHILSGCPRFCVIAVTAVPQRVGLELCSGVFERKYSSSRAVSDQTALRKYRVWLLVVLAWDTWVRFERRFRRQGGQTGLFHAGTAGNSNSYSSNTPVFRGEYVQ